VTFQKKVLCRVCGSIVSEKNHLFYCQSEVCSAVFWNKSAIKKIKKNLKEDYEFKKNFLIDAGVPVDNTNGHFVYKLRLRGQINSIYVGLTGLHPHERYLNHLIGYKASRKVKKFATSLIGFEGPMKYEKAKKREPELAQELRECGYNIWGGH
jgi:predicted GIY-YIG superfamily endonuclease